MNKLPLDQDQVLLVASRGEEAQHGLWLWSLKGKNWAGHQISQTQHLSSLTGHPSLPIVYGTAATGQGGMLYAWRIDGSGVAPIGETSSQGLEPCHLAVDPTGRLLVVTNYDSESLALQLLDKDGLFKGKPALLELRGDGPDKQRQDAAHPHQALFVGNKLVVIDLGADLIREFSVDLQADGRDLLSEVRSTVMPPGTGPRHAVVLPDGRLAVTGELSETLVVGHLGTPPDQWAAIRSTGLTGPGKTRWARNYPGDIALSKDGRRVHLANRSHDSLASFDISGSVPVLLGEQNTGGHWPQHIITLGDQILVANWDSSSVTSLPLIDGIPQVSQPLFECKNAAWLHLHRLN